MKPSERIPKFIGMTISPGVTQMTGAEAKINEIIDYLDEQYEAEQEFDFCVKCGLSKSEILNCKEK